MISTYFPLAINDHMLLINDGKLISYKVVLIKNLLDKKFIWLCADICVV